MQFPNGAPDLKSPPSRGRGLKRCSPTLLCSPRWSPPSRGRGLKRRPGLGDGGGRASPPSRGRGLKRAGQRLRPTAPRSPPSRGRGLKLTACGGSCWRMLVAPFTGAWIETPCNHGMTSVRFESPPSRGRGLKPSGYPPSRAWTSSPPSRGRGLKRGRDGKHAGGSCRPLHGGVD